MIMRKQLLLFVAMLLPLVANAHDIEVPNVDSKTIYYKWNSDHTGLIVTYNGRYYNSYDEYSGEVVIPESVNYGGKDFPVTSIGLEAFKGCTQLNSVTIPNSVTSIGSSAFENCMTLTSVNIPNSVTSIGSSAFYYCINLTSVNIPNSVTSIAESLFAYCSNLTSVTIPNSVTSIGGGSFYGCSALTTAYIPNNVTTIGNNAFYNCSTLTSVTIPNSVTSIGEQAFCSCSNLASVIIGNGVTSIGYNVFNFTNLKKVIWLTNTPPSGYENVNVYDAVNYVSNNNFTSLSNIVTYPFLSSYFDVDGIRYVPVSPSERTCDAIDCVYDSTAINTVIASTVSYKGISMNVKNILPYLAYNNKYIKSLNINIDGKVSKFAFTNCSNMNSATLGENVNAIDQYAFQECSKLQRIVIPNSIKSIGIYAFQNCSALEYAQIGKGIETISNYTFSGCSSLQEMIIGSNVSNIGQSAFSSCSALPKITIPGTVSLIKDYAFSGCKSLKEVVMEDSESELKLGSNGSSPLFASCKLDSVYIGRNISYNTSSNYGYSPFYRNTSLRAVKITDKETEISQNEFYGCTNLQRVMIGDGVTTISDYAFSGCQSLKYFTFGTQVKTIGKEAFSDCTSVVEIASKAQTPPTCGNQALDDINKWNCKLFVPKGCIASYQAADQWKDFFFTEEGEGTGSEGSGETESQKCEKPTISYINGQLSFASETEGAEFVTEIADSDIKRHYDANIQLTATYTISVYATKAGYDNSDVATATLCWIDVDPKTEGIENSIAQVRANPVLIQSNNGQITITGAEVGTSVFAYSVSGHMVASTHSNGAKTTLFTDLRRGEVAIIKIGDKSIKIVIQ